MTLDWYLAICEDWLSSIGVSPLGDSAVLVRDVCQFHRFIQPGIKHGEPLPPPARSQALPGSKEILYRKRN
jgi:hypothetical protein